MPIDTVFELRDISNDEMYFSIGLFLTEQDTHAAIFKNCHDLDWKPPCSPNEDFDEVISLSIWARPVGLDEGSSVWEGRWLNIYDEKLDLYRWKMETPLEMKTPKDLDKAIFICPPELFDEVEQAIAAPPKVNDKLQTLLNAPPFPFRTLTMGEGGDRKV